MARRLSVTRPTNVPFARVRRALVEDPGLVLCHTGRPTPNLRTFMVELTAGRDGGGPHVRELVEMEITGVHLDPERVIVDLRWRAVHRARLFPTFVGTLDVRPWPSGAVVLLSGTYEPPLGIVGAFGDGVVGHRLARQSVEHYLDEVIGRLETSVPRRQEPAAHAR